MNPFQRPEWAKMSFSATSVILYGASLTWNVAKSYPTYHWGRSRGVDFWFLTLHNILVCMPNGFRIVQMRGCLLLLDS